MSNKGKPADKTDDKGLASDDPQNVTISRTAEPVQSDPAASVGLRSRRALMMKEFIPHRDFIAKEVVGKGAGTKVILGRIYGFVTGVSEKKGKLPNGEESVSIVCNGSFEAENYLTGELSAAASVYFASAFSEAIKTLFAMDPELKMVEVDADIGVEATGKTIPYTWVVVNHVEGAAQTPLTRLRTARGRPANAAALAAPNVAQIAAQ